MTRNAALVSVCWAVFVGFLVFALPVVVPLAWLFTMWSLAGLHRRAEISLERLQRLARTSYDGDEATCMITDHRNAIRAAMVAILLALPLSLVAPFWANACVAVAAAEVMPMVVSYASDLVETYRQ